MRGTFMRAATPVAAPIALVSCGGSGYGHAMSPYPPTAVFSQPVQTLTRRGGTRREAPALS